MVVDPKKKTFQAQFLHKGPFTLEVPDSQDIKGEGKIRRNADVIDGVMSRPDPTVATTFDLVSRSAREYPKVNAAGSRKLIKMHNETKQIKKVVDGKEEMVDKKWSYFELSGYDYVTYEQYFALVKQLGAGMRKLGLETGDRVHIYAATSRSWLSMAHASGSQSFAFVTAYDTLGEEGLEHSLKETNAKLIFLDPSLLTNLINPLKNAKDIKFVVYSSESEVKQANIDKLKEAHPNVTILSYDDLKKLGIDNPVDPVPPKPEDLCGIMYTSGSTGPPKGVPLTHKNVIAGVAGAHGAYGDFLGPGDRLLAYLPLAHILEFVFENIVIFWGATLGYGNPKTLSDASVRNCAGDIREFQPSVLVGVPAVFETVRKGIINKVNSGSAITKALFWAALSAKNFLLNNGLPGAGFLDTLVFKKVSAATGGKMRVMLCGGGPISKETQRFLSLAIAPMVNGYGLTETAAMGVLMHPEQWTDKATGAIVKSIEVKLVDYPEAGYFSTNNPPQGEVWIRGDSVIKEYYKNEKETKESFAPGGWFMTGDIGEWDHNGHLRLIDRKKNLVKTMNGEYIALEKLESTYRSAPVVQNICVYADESKTKPIAIIVPVEPALKKLADSVGVQGEELDALCKNKKVQKAALNDLLRQGRESGLKGIELIQGVVLAPEEWTPQNGYLTNAQKLVRKKIVQDFKKEIDAAYKEN